MLTKLDTRTLTNYIRRKFNTVFDISRTARVLAMLEAHSLKKSFAGYSSVSCLVILRQAGPCSTFRSLRVNILLNKDRQRSMSLLSSGAAVRSSSFMGLSRSISSMHLSSVYYWAEEWMVFRDFPHVSCRHPGALRYWILFLPDVCPRLLRSMLLSLLCAFLNTCFLEDGMLRSKSRHSLADSESLNNMSSSFTSSCEKAASWLCSWVDPNSLLFWQATWAGFFI